MAILIADRVQETSTSPGGTGTLTLTGSPVPGYKSFSSGIGTGNSFYYTIYDAVTYAWEVGIGSWTANVLTRTTVLSNSLNTTAFISFTNGNTLNVWVDYPSESAVAQTDVGTAPNQVPLNQYLGSMAYEDKAGVILTGDANINGLTAGKGNSSLSANTVYGYQAGNSITTGNASTFIGYQAGQTNTTGIDNTFIGYLVGKNNLGGGTNTAVGGTDAVVGSTLQTNTSGSNNSAFGNGALALNSTGNNLTAIGYQALVNNTASGNTALGYSSGSAITTGANNVIVGSYTGSGAPISATGSNYIVLSDGQANVRAYWNGADLTTNGNFTATGNINNTRINPRVLASTANSATPTLNTDNYDMMVITGQTVAITSFTTNLTGTPVNGQKLWIAITSTNTGLTFGASFESSTVTLPTALVASTRLDIGFVWNVATSKWRCVAVA